MNRRTLLAFTGTALAAVAGGCLGSGVGVEDDTGNDSISRDGGGDGEQGDVDGLTDALDVDFL